MMPRIKFSLKLRVFLAVALLYLAALGTLTYLTIRLQRNLLLEQMAERAKAAINLMELSVAPPLYKWDIRNLRIVVVEAKALPNVEYAYVYDPEGRIVGDFHETEEKLFSIFTDPLSLRIIKSNETLVDIDYEKGIMDISKPVILGHQKLGGMRLGFNLDPTLSEMRLVTLRALSISVAIFLVGLFMIFGITVRMTKPIERLTEAAKRIEAGDLQHRVSIKRNDEIGSLAEAFDQMAERLMQREKELKQTQSLIRRADKLASLGQLTAGLAHEIRNPLVAIRTFTQLLPERYLDPEFRASFKDLALKEVDRICNLVADLLAFARPSAPKVSAEDVNEIVGNIVRILETEAKKKDVQIDLSAASGLPRVLIDKEQIKQVCMNLILNALQSMEGEGAVEVSTRLFSKNGDRYVQIGVKDSGVGIPEKDLESIFDPFFTTKKGGSGLGLSISHQIVQEHGGHILVDSKVGQGTTFLVNLPVKPRKEKSQPSLTFSTRFENC